MAQMLPMVQIVPEMNFAYDPVSGLISSSLGSGIVLLSMDDVNEQVAKVELAADEMIASLDPYTSPVNWILISYISNICCITYITNIGGFIDG